MVHDIFANNASRSGHCRQVRSNRTPRLSVVFGDENIRLVVVAAMPVQRHVAAPFGELRCREGTHPTWTGDEFLDRLRIARLRFVVRCFCGRCGTCSSRLKFHRERATVNGQFTGQGLTGQGGRELSVETTGIHRQFNRLRFWIELAIDVTAAADTTVEVASNLASLVHPHDQVELGTVFRHSITQELAAPGTTNDVAFDGFGLLFVSRFRVSSFVFPDGLLRLASLFLSLLPFLLFAFLNTGVDGLRRLHLVLVDHAILVAIQPIEQAPHAFRNFVLLKLAVLIGVLFLQAIKNAFHECRVRHRATAPTLTSSTSSASWSISRTVFRS